MFVVEKQDRTGTIPYDFSISCNDLFEYTDARRWLRDTYGETEGLSSPYYDNLRSKHWSTSVTTHGISMRATRRLFLQGNEELMMFMLRWGDKCSKAEDSNS